MLPLAIAIAAVFGAAVGSFVNVVAYRVPLGRSVINPPSACPRCGQPISARYNIPIAGWLILRGRCHDCGQQISVRYPVVELAGALLFAATTVVVGVNRLLPAHLWFVAVGLALILTDFDHKRIPNRILYPGTAVASVLLAAGALFEGRRASLLTALVGASAYFGALFLLALIARGGFGFGDVKLAFLLGLFAGFRSLQTVATAAFFAFAIGGTVAIVLLAARRRGRKDELPFGPSMVVGCWLAITFTPQVLGWYLN